MSKSKNDIAWEKIFEKYCILDKLANNERISISSTNFNTHDYVLTHSTVITTNLLYCNWGWNGTYNGYFTVLNSCSVGSDVYVNLGMIISIDVI